MAVRSVQFEDIVSPLTDCLPGYLRSLSGLVPEVDAGLE
jgi:hypothetical protein